MIVVFILYTRDVMRVAALHGGYGSWTNMMNAFRLATSYEVVEEGEGTNSLLFFLYKFFIQSSYYFIYVLVNNYISKKKVQFVYIAIITTIIIASSLTSSRSDMLQIPISALIIYEFLSEYRKGSSTTVNIKKVVTIGILIILVMFGLSFFRALVGRKSTVDPLYYITYYAGGSIAALDLYLQSPLPPSSVWGKETFNNLINYIGQFFNIPSMQYIGHLEFRRSNGVSVGNVYTGFRAYYQDFGIAGVIICTSLFAIFFAILYLYAKKTTRANKCGKINIPFLIFFSVAQIKPIWTFFFNESFLTRFPVTFLRHYVFIFITYFIFTKMKIRGKNRQVLIIKRNFIYK
jgi:oligosaccharide repeat unit polymerase